MIRTYEEFVSLLNEKGFMLFSGDGYLSLADVTAPEAWHTGGPLDPWGWKDRLAQARDGAYAHMFAGRGGFVSRKWYPLFYVAYWEDLDESYALGLAPRLALDMWRLFDERPVWGRHELRRALSGRFAKKAEFERALRLLERTMQITISGQVQPLSANGMPMGWQAMEYARVDMYLADWLSDAEPDAATARQIIRTHAFETWPSLSDAEFARCFFKI